MFPASLFILGNMSPTAGIQKFYLKLCDCGKKKNKKNKKSCQNNAEMYCISPFSHMELIVTFILGPVPTHGPQSHAVKMFGIPPHPPHSTDARSESLQTSAQSYAKIIKLNIFFRKMTHMFNKFQYVNRSQVWLQAIQKLHVDGGSQFSESGFSKLDSPCGSWVLPATVYSFCAPTKCKIEFCIQSFRSWIWFHKRHLPRPKRTLIMILEIIQL